MLIGSFHYEEHNEVDYVICVILTDKAAFLFDRK